MTHVSKPVVLINLSSSTSEDISGALRSIFQRYGHAAPHVIVGSSEDMTSMMSELREARGDLLISFGGDGTAAAVASIARDQDVPFLALPGGTMNMLMQGLYGTDRWQDCLLRGLACAGPRPMTAGVVTDRAGQNHLFLVAAIFGQAVQMSEAREELREGRVLTAARGAVEALQKSKENRTLNVTLPGSDRTYEEELINVTCPFMSPTALNPDQMEVTLVDALTGTTTLALGLSVLRGENSAHKSITQLEASSFQIESDEPIEALLDGEPHQFEGPIGVTLNQHCGTVMAPRPAMSFPKAPTPS